MRETCLVVIVVLLLLKNANGIEEKCKFCEKTFKTLSKHIWRCSKKITQSAYTQDGNHGNENIETQNRSLANVGNESIVIAPEGVLTDYDERVQRRKESHYIECHCGKRCNGYRGLRAHQRFCHVNDTPELRDLFTHEIEQLNNSAVENHDDNVIGDCIKRIPKKGIKLPKSSAEWNIANDFFKLHLNCNNEIEDINKEIKNIQNTLYDYFADNYGTVGGESDDLKQHYGDLSKRQLKKELRNLKNQNNPNNDRAIRYISKQIRAKYSKSAIKDRDHNTEIKENFWKYCKNTFEKPKDNSKPDFDEKECREYFSKSFKKNSKTNYNFPSWMKMLEEPTELFNNDPPSYQEITKIINKMKSSGSPCPHDQMSIIILKRCPYLRTVLHHIINHCWKNQTFPEEWRYAFTILIYKRECNKNPSNFRPITLQPVLAKVMSSLIRNRMYTYLVKNKFIETNLQKGFWSEVSGCVEHTELLTYIMNHARLKQRQVIITLLDLKNAFGEIDHQVIMKILEYHHFPESIKSLIKSYYTNYKVSVGTETFTTDPILIEKGVLQGDCLSPLLFNLVVNTLLKTIDTEKIRAMGYNCCDSLRPRHWFQFADDSALVTSTAEDSQSLLNVFTKWCHWAGLKICPRKCKTFAMKKDGTKTVQFHPYLKVNNEQIPTIKEGEEFVYLGKKFTMCMKTEKEEIEIKKDLRTYAETIHRTPLHPKNKIAIIVRYVYSKLRWRLSTYDFSQTWVKQNLNSIVTEYVKRWLNLHQGANTRHLFLPTNKLGIRFSLPSDIHKACQMVKRSILKSSKNQEIKDLYKLTVKKHIEEERILDKGDKNTANKLLRKETVNSIVNEMEGLKEQNTILKEIRILCTGKIISQWHEISEEMTSNIFKFARKALIFSLPVNTNLKRWKKIISDECQLCSGRQTQLHVLNNCSKAAADGRYNWRHDSILFTIMHYVRQLVEKGYEVYADLVGYKQTSELFKNLRPDIAVKKGDDVTSIELTCCFETNLTKSNTYKRKRYENLEKDLITKRKLTKLYIEVSSLGFIPKTNDAFNNILKQHDINTYRLNKKISETALRCSYYLYTQRNNEWNEKEILKFY
jgi:hypothetical protein